MLNKYNNSFDLEYHSIVDDYKKKSKYMWNLVINQKEQENQKNTIPKTIIQYWDNIKEVPHDVSECMKTWNKFQNEEINYLLFDDYSAKDFISSNYDKKHVLAFENCFHPAMRSDYFRMCYILLLGGVYIDADDVCLLTDIKKLFIGNKLKVQALCYDNINSVMIATGNAYTGEYLEDNIYYVNNNPLISPPNNKIIKRALDTATNSLINITNKHIDIQAITGPGNLVNSIIWNSLKDYGMNNECKIYTDWEQMVVSKWPLDYRKDNRNWRNWKQV